MWILSCLEFFVVNSIVSGMFWLFFVSGLVYTLIRR